MSFTSHFLSLSPDAYRRATQHPFLKAAGTQSISKERLEHWLTQDRIFALIAGPKFPSLLISRIPLRVSSSASPTLEERTLDLLSQFLSNVVRELKFFKNTALENGLDITRQPKHGLSVENDLTGSITKAYTDFLIASAATANIGEGMFMLWAMEKCYFDAWTHARSYMDTSSPASSAGTSRALEAFIQNWSSPEFRVFVDDLAALVDEQAAALSPREYEALKQKAEEIWRWVLWYEERFWDGE